MASSSATTSSTSDAGPGRRPGRRGVDVSAPAIERADTQVYRFPQERFDLAISRFGTIFFNDPAVAFANIRRRCARPGGWS